MPVPVEALRAALEREPDVQLAVLFGSFATQRARSGSDIDLGVLTVPGFGDADALRAAAGLRNRIAHGDALLDYRRVQAEALEGIPVLRRFLDAVARAAGL